MKTISVCMIVKNEESTLNQCLRQARKFADEILVADTGSEDMTPEIAMKYADKVYFQEWHDDFSQARNQVSEHSSCDYILSLDADEFISDMDVKKLLLLKETLKDEQTVSLVCVRPEFGTKALQPRIVRRSEIPYWHGKVHERLIFREPHMNTDIEFVHRCLEEPDYERNVRIMRTLSDEHLRNDYWLMIQLFLDCCLAGDLAEDKNRLLSLMEQNTEVFSAKIPVTRLAADVLKNREHPEDIRILSKITAKAFRREWHSLQIKK